ncbi:MAG: MBL fold metallo-hydrolase [Lentimicrobiaceae bacterium]|jgi:phosphoribosyl 1,2-cyclic phosphodiesterase|nr:MBL fold metallo-hydrolase [Lentimicrobiaceae bacterium]
MIYIISTGSKGNAVIYDTILVDCGVPFSKIKPYLSKIELVLLTHEHGDHFNLKTIKKLAFEKPTLRFGCGEFLSDKLIGIRSVDIYAAGKIYNYGKFKISPVILYHDVKNFGYRIFINEKKIFHSTDTAHLKGITAKNYDVYALEANYDEGNVENVINEKISRGEYAHQIASIHSHLSLQQAQDFILNNAGETYEFIRLHESEEF